MPDSFFTLSNVRFSRPTNQLDRLLHFYCEGLGFQIAMRFPEDTAGYSGAILGLPGHPSHLEFCTHTLGFARCQPPTQDNLLVFYLEPSAKLEEIKKHMIDSGYPPVPSTNPHWEQEGVTFEDPDGWRVVLMLRNNISTEK